ncbi:MAG: hypothetical protein IPI04_01380 [Ignavibacteria bacterium]|nr:hypothetical protein [Ignavibacteria bacterium]
MKLNIFKRISAIIFILLSISVSFNTSESSISIADTSENIPEGLKNCFGLIPIFLIPQVKTRCTGKTELRWFIMTE